MLVYLYNTHLFYATRYKLIHWCIYCKRLPPPLRAHSYIQTQPGERGNVGVVRERGRTADDRVIKADLHPPHRAGRWATVHPSTVL